MRLVEANANAGIAYYSNIPAAFHPSAREWLVIPIFHIFGSEELSRHAAAVAELAPKPYVAINPIDAVALGVTEGDSLNLCWNEETAMLPVILRSDLPRGIAGVPSGVPPVQAFTEPVPGTFLEVAANVAAVRSEK